MKSAWDNKIIFHEFADCPLSVIVYLNRVIPSYGERFIFRVYRGIRPWRWTRPRPVYSFQYDKEVVLTRRFFGNVRWQSDSCVVHGSHVTFSACPSLQQAAKLYRCIKHSEWRKTRGHGNIIRSACVCGASACAISASSNLLHQACWWDMHDLASWLFYSLRFHSAYVAAWIHATIHAVVREPW